ncbi:hypothetical protein ACGF0D_37730 [Kitasatospora sp. NPDC048298]|uniref:hypothetical protein n=1 Tax=Kitasatospora sp. NPDC048298 TaxID=3364049 RepID=UPI00371C6D57
MKSAIRERCAIALLATAVVCTFLVGLSSATPEPGSAHRGRTVGATADQLRPFHSVLRRHYAAGTFVLKGLRMRPVAVVLTRGAR